MKTIAEWLAVTPGAVSKLIQSSERLERVDLAYRTRLGVVREALRKRCDSCLAIVAPSDGS